MYQAEDRDPLIGHALSVMRANTGPLGLAVVLALAAHLVSRAGHVPGETGLTWAGFAATVLHIAGFALATLVGWWSVCSGGRPAGFAALGAIEVGRILRVAGYAVLFCLLYFALAAVLSKIATSILGSETGLSAALLVAGIHAVTMLLVYVQLGFLFPDTLTTGDSGIVLALALGIATARRIFAALVLPAALLSFPQVFLDRLVPGHGEIQGLVAVALAALTVAGAVTYAVAMTRLYLDISPAGRFHGGMWR
jgi:hypothetical protein